jgi:hypothetical protein
MLLAYWNSWMMNESWIDFEKWYKKRIYLWNYLILSCFIIFYNWWRLAVLGENIIYLIYHGFKYLMIHSHAIVLFYHSPLVPIPFFLALSTSLTHYSSHFLYFPILSLSYSYTKQAPLRISQTHQSIIDELIIVFLTSLWWVHINFVTNIFLLLVVCLVFMILIADLEDLGFALII